MYGSIINWFVVLLLVIFVAVRFGVCDSAEYPEHRQEYHEDGQILEEEVGTKNSEGRLSKI